VLLTTPPRTICPQVQSVASAASGSLGDRLRARREPERQQGREQQRADGQMAAHHRRAQQLPHRERAQQRLCEVERDGESGERAEPGAGFGVRPHPQRGRQQHHAHQQRDQAVTPLDQHVELERRDQAALAQRPVRARQTGSRGADGGADHDQREHQKRGRKAEPRGAGVCGSRHR
jgi:hypothetical protein